MRDQLVRSALHVPLQLSMSTRFILALMADAADDEGVCPLTVCDMARKTGVDRRTIQRCQRRLEDLRLIERGTPLGLFSVRIAPNMATAA